MCRVIAVLFLMLSFRFASAQLAPGDSALGFISQLRIQGVSEIGELDLKKFEREMKQINWNQIPEVPAQDFNGKRRSAFYLTKNKQVFVADNLPLFSRVALDKLEMHESFGALGLGHHDLNYELTTALGILNDLKDQKTRKAMVSTYAKTLFRNLSSGGGVSVGGGGDLIAIVAKTRVLQLILKAPITPSKDFLVNYPKVVFEPFYKPEMQFVGMEYSLNNSSGQKQEVMKIYVPALKWESSEKYRNQITNEIADKILSLFMSHSQQTTVSVTPLFCAENHKITFPQAKDPAIRSMQTLRATIFAPCKDVMTIHGVTIRSPRW